MKRPSFQSLGAVLVLIVITAVFSGCVAQAPAKAPPAVQRSYQDAELLRIGAESGKALGPLLANISDDASANDIASLETDSAELSAVAGNFYFQMKDLNVSPKYQAWKTNYTLGLLDLVTAGDYFSKSAIAARSENFPTALTYLEQGTTLFERSNYYLNMAHQSVRE